MSNEFSSGYGKEVALYSGNFLKSEEISSIVSLQNQVALVAASVSRTRL
ncbi:hypothetical protein [Endozoicomonas elysicola]|nr:hypothetical protein [Endozoicomonas elysicola]